MNTTAKSSETNIDENEVNIPTNSNKVSDEFTNDLHPIDTLNNGSMSDAPSIITELDRLRGEVVKLKKTIEAREPEIIAEMNSLIEKDLERIKSIELNEHILPQDKTDLITAFNGNISQTRKHYTDKINSMKTELAEKQAHLDEEEKIGRGKNWDYGNIQTLNTWIKECNKQQFVYESVLDKIIDKSKTIKVVMLILCAIQSLATVSNLGLNETDHFYAVWVIKISLSVISVLVYILTQIMTIEKFEDTIKRYTLYTDTVETFLSNIVSTADIKLELRPDGDQFILENKETYAKIYRDSPYIKKSYWIEGIADYNEYLESTQSGTNYHARKRRLYDRFAVDNNIGIGTETDIGTNGSKSVEKIPKKLSYKKMSTK